jgi:hypothetical protein
MSGTVMLTPATFRAMFGPAFVDASLYSNDTIEYWLTDSYATMNASVWKSQLNKGAAFRAAHFIVLMQRAGQASTTGGIPGASGGILSAKSVGPVSASYDTTSGLDPDGMSWNQTTYGQQYWRIAKLVGMGGRLSLFCAPGGGGYPGVY